MIYYFLYSNRRTNENVSHRRGFNHKSCENRAPGIEAHIKVINSVAFSYVSILLKILITDKQIGIIIIKVPTIPKSNNN